MRVSEAYDQWSEQYDSNVNPTRDLEAQALRQVLGNIQVDQALELGCGTGKNSGFLLERSRKLLAVDGSAEMLARARDRHSDPNASFVQADLLQEWTFAPGTYDLLTFSLVLEHIEDLDTILRRSAGKLRPGGLLYIGELHPFKQYSGSRARFETEAGTTVVDCYTHHTSDFLSAALQQGLVLKECQEFFDTPDRSGLPRILALLFQKPAV